MALGLPLVSLTHLLTDLVWGTCPDQASSCPESLLRTGPVPASTKSWVGLQACTYSHDTVT